MTPHPIAKRRVSWVGNFLPLVALKRLNESYPRTKVQWHSQSAILYSIRSIRYNPFLYIFQAVFLKTVFQKYYWIFESFKRCLIIEFEKNTVQSELIKAELAMLITISWNTFNFPFGWYKHIIPLLLFLMNFLSLWWFYLFTKLNMSKVW